MGILITKIEPADEEGTVIGSAITNIAPPSSYSWGKKDISGQGAGRTTAYNMIKKLKAKVRTLNLVWAGKSYAEMAVIFQSFDHEYAWITYMDGITGTAQRKHFYMGDFEANSFTATNGGTWESGSLQCIQGITDKIT